MIKWDRPVTGGATLWLGVASSSPLQRFSISVASGTSRFPAAEPPRPIDAPKRLVTNGVYRYSRNPIYVAVLIAIAGWASLFQSLALVAYGVVLFALYSFFVQRHEEPHLAREYGDEYAAYTASTGRWLPRLRRKDRS